MSKSCLLFHISDVHFGLEDQRALDWVKHEISRLQPDGLIITGDLTMRARHEEFAKAGRWMAQIPVPIALEPGNHDLPGYHLPERYLHPLRRFDQFKQSLGNPLTQPMLPGLALVGLNTNVAMQPRSNWSKGWVSEKALANCLAQIDALADGTKALVLAHHPLREAGTDGTAFTHGGNRALEALARRNVEAVLSGHVHDPFDIVETTAAGPVRMIGAGTLSTRLRSSAPSFNQLEWDGNTLSVKVRELEPA